MAIELLTLNRAVVLSSAVVYWAGVWLQVRRVRKRIGRSPNVRPRGVKEKLLWAGWAFVVASWFALPFLSGAASALPSCIHPVGSFVGVLMMLGGYAGTLWCYVAMGDAWRMGVLRNEKTWLVNRGPYLYVRHPIYLFQIVMVAAIAILLPSIFSLIVLVIHVLCISTKAADEETHLGGVLGASYEAYCATAGRWFPRWSRHKPLESPPKPKE